MDPAHLPQFTLEDWRRREGDRERIEGLPYAMAPSPAVSHRAVGAKLVRQQNGRLVPCPRCMVIHETDWEVEEDTVIRPDCMVLCDRREERVRPPHARLVELALASSAPRDEPLKFGVAEREGVPYSLLRGPQWRVTKIFAWRQARYVKAAHCAAETSEFRPADRPAPLGFARVWPDRD